MPGARRGGAARDAGLLTVPRGVLGTGFRSAFPSAFRSAFRSLSVRNFRLFAAGQVLSVSGTWMMVVGQDWLVLSLTDSPGTALAAVTAAQFTPMLLLTLYGGRLADRHAKRPLLVWCNAASGAGALGLGVLVALDAARLWHLLLFGCWLGTVNAVEVPTRMAFVGELVGPGLLPNASALSAAYFNVARVVGPAAAGLLIAVAGVGPLMLLNAVSHVAVVVALRRMDPAALRPVAPGAPGRIADGLRYVRGRPDLVVTLTLVACVALFGMNFPLTLPLLAKTVFHASAGTFGLLTTAFALGSLAGALATTARRTRPSARLVAGTALVFGVLEAASGRAPGYGSAAVLLAATGCAAIVFSQAANHRVQLGSDPRYRGRVLALYTLILQGSTPIGAVLVGWLTTRFDARAGLYAGGLLSLVSVLAVVFADRLRRRRRSARTERERARRAAPGLR
ncbi:MFS transporter [Streptomyces antibioticus]|uniref:MFS transporter n=1 Tax=Streptomyces antibioticus TaxID=1890 RepID=UPI0036BBCA90